MNLLRKLFGKPDQVDNKSKEFDEQLTPVQKNYLINDPAVNKALRDLMSDPNATMDSVVERYNLKSTQIGTIFKIAKTLSEDQESHGGGPES